MKMNADLQKLNQINSLCYWLNKNTTYRCNMLLDSDEDVYRITVKKGNQGIYTYSIESFEKKNSNIVEFELSAIINNLLYYKDNYQDKK